MNIRKIGFWMVAVGGAALVIGLISDAVDNADNPSRAANEGIFDLSSFPHALFFAGIAVAVLGVCAMLVGARLYEPVERVTVGRRLAQVGAPIAAVALVFGSAVAANSSGLADGNNKKRTITTEPASANDGASTDTTTADEHAMEHNATTAGAEHDMASMGSVIPGTATGKSPCEIAQPTPASPGQVGAGEAGASGTDASVGEHGHRGMTVQEPLTKEQRDQLEQQMEQARSVVAKYPTVAAAEAAGYKKSTPYVPCIGAHYTNVGLVAKFDPAAPSELLYDGTNPDSKIVGLSYLVYNAGGKPPEGFAGPNDHFHQHNANGGLCFKGGVAGGQVIGGEEMTREECTKIGGTKRELTDIYMEHAWVVPGFECSWGVFAGECPELGGRLAGTAWDPPDPNAGKNS